MKPRRTETPLQQFADDAFTLRAGQHSVGLHLLDGTGGIATGVLVEYRGRCFLVSAGHFLKLVSRDEIGVFWPPRRMPKTSSVDRFTPQILAEVARTSRFGKAESLRLGRRLILDNPKIDVGVAEVDRNGFAGRAEPFVVPSTRLCKLSGGMPVLLCGVPNQASRRQRTGPATVREFRMFAPFVSTVLEERRPASWQDPAGNRTFDHRTNFAISLNLESFGFTPEGILGISGCGVWTTKRPTAKAGVIWQPQPVLMGIETAYLASHQAVKATRLSVILRRIRQKFIASDV